MMDSEVFIVTDFPDIVLIAATVAKNIKDGRERSLHFTGRCGTSNSALDIDSHGKGLELRPTSVVQHEDPFKCYLSGRSDAFFVQGYLDTEEGGGQLIVSLEPLNAVR